MSVVLTVPAVEAVLLFQRQECETCRGSGHLGPATAAKQADYGRSCPGCEGDGTVPLAEWVTVDAEPMVAVRVPRPLQPGDRVTVVAGELPEHLSEHGDWLACTLSDPFVVDMDERALNLPAPGTVLGTATVDLVLEMRDGIPPQDEWTDPWHIVTLSPWPIEMYWRGFGSANPVGPITNHDHCDWTPGRWAVRLTDTEAAK